MIATTVAYDLVFVCHLAAALVTIAVLVALRMSSASAAIETDRVVLRQRFPDRINWAARCIHLVALTGIVMAATGDAGVSFSHAWIHVGLACYVAAALVLEAGVLPLERSFARAVGNDAEVPRDVARQLGRRLDVVLAVIGVALVAMIVQF